MNNLFGYGSLLSPASLAKTIGREIPFRDFRPALLLGYRRTWTATGQIELADTSERKSIAFLDLSQSDGACNGALVQINVDA